MEKKSLKIHVYILLLILLFTVTQVKAQEVENYYQTRTSVNLSFKPIKKVTFNITPELRLDENFALDKYLLEAEAQYKPIKFISLSAAYRITGNPRDTKATEYLHRFDLGVTAKQDYNRFTPAIRIRYSNYADDETTKKDFLRYKGSVKYDIRKSKLTPFIGIEAFQQLTNGDLYKMRYSTGLDIKLSKKNSIGANYKLDYYQKEYKNKHILSIAYKLKF